MTAHENIQLRPQTDGSTAPPSPRVAAWSGTLAALFLGVMLWLFGSAPPELERPVNIESLPSVDGTLLEVDSRKLVLEPFRALDGKDEVTFRIRKADAGHFDIAHLRSHSSIALPTRLYYERDGDTYYAVYKEDAPANSRREAGVID